MFGFRIVEHLHVSCGAPELAASHVDNGNDSVIMAHSMSLTQLRPFFPPQRDDHILNLTLDFNSLLSTSRACHILTLLPAFTSLASTA